MVVCQTSNREVADSTPSQFIAG